MQTSNNIKIWHTPQRMVTVKRNPEKLWCYQVVVQEKGGNDPYILLESDNKDAVLYEARKKAETIREIRGKRAVFREWSTVNYDYKTGCSEVKAVGRIYILRDERYVTSVPIDAWEIAYNLVESGIT